VTSCSISSSESAFSASGRLGVTTVIAPSRSLRTSSLTLLLEEALDRRLRLLGRHREREPVAGVVDRLVPREVAPEVEVLLRVARRLRKLPREVLDHVVDLGVELRGRHDAVHEAPLLALLRRDLLAHEHDLASPPVADHDRQPLRRAAGRHRSMLGAYVAYESVVDHDREVAGHLEFVAAADGDPVDARDGRLADLPQSVVRVLEGTEPLPVLGRLVEVVLGPRAEVGAHAERAPRACEHDDANLVVPRRVLAGPRARAEHLEIEGVQDLRAVEGDRRPWRRLVVKDLLEAELVGRDRLRVRGLSQLRRSGRGTGCPSPSRPCRWPWI